MCLLRIQHWEENVQFFSAFIFAIVFVFSLIASSVYVRSPFFAVQGIQIELNMLPKRMTTSTEVRDFFSQNFITIMTFLADYLKIRTIASCIDRLLVLNLRMPMLLLPGLSLIFFTFCVTHVRGLILYDLIGSRI